MFLQILIFLLKFRALLSICLPCCFLGSPLKWFTLSCPSVIISLELFLLEPQHPASCYCSAWVDPASMVPPWICLLEQCFLALRFVTDVLSGSIFEREGKGSLHIYRDYCLSFYFSYGTKLFSLLSPPPCKESWFCLFWAVQLCSHFRILTDVLVFNLLFLNLQIHSLEGTSKLPVSA